MGRRGNHTLKIEIFPSRAVGFVTAPPSKSHAHRLLIGASLSEGISRLDHFSFSDDLRATSDCLSSLGASFRCEGDVMTVSGASMLSLKPKATLCCRESGSTLRFLIPLALTLGETVCFTGSKRLLSRPLSVYENLAGQKHFLFEKTEETLSVRGPLTAGAYEIPGSVSSQFISGLLMALPLLPGDSTLKLIPPIVSRPYIELTLSVLNRFGIRIDRTEETAFFIPGNQRYVPLHEAVEGDFSNAAFLSAFSFLSGHVAVGVLSSDSKQGDRVYPHLFTRLQNGFIDENLSDCPDLAPILFLMAALKHGARFTGVSRLREKESDRIASMREEMAKCGLFLTEKENEVVIPGNQKPFSPTQTLLSHGDHRIAMALTVLLSQVGGELDGAEAVGKSFPAFYDTLQTLGIVLKRKE